MPHALVAGALHFAERIDRYLTPEEVILALDETVTPTVRVFSIYPVPPATQRGSRRPYRIYHHPDLDPYFREFWLKFAQHGPSVIARHGWRTHRDFSLRDVVREEKPAPADLWIFNLLRAHGIGDVKYVCVLNWWYGTFWSPKRNVVLEKAQWRGLRIATRAAAERIEELEGLRKSWDQPRLTGQERAVLRLLRQDNSMAEVGKLLGMSPASVKVYVARAKRKLGTTALRDTIAEAVRRYVILGIVVGLATGVVEAADLCFEHLPFPDQPDGDLTWKDDTA